MSPPGGRDSLIRRHRRGATDRTSPPADCPLPKAARMTPARASVRPPSGTTDPLLRPLLLMLGVALPVLTLPAAVGWPVEPFLLFTTYVVLLGGSVWSARRSGGSPAVRRLFHGLMRWRIGWRAWGLAVVALPAATVAIAGVTGTLQSPTRGLDDTAISYLLGVTLVGPLVVNLWEEAVWTGRFQRPLVQRFGGMGGAARVAVPFALVHVPLVVGQADGVRDALATITLLGMMAPVLRYLLVLIDGRTNGSLLAVAVAHAAFNGSGSLDVVTGGWQQFVALAAVTIALALRETGRSRAERLAAVRPESITTTRQQARPKPAAASSTPSRHEAPKPDGDHATQEIHDVPDTSHHGHWPDQALRRARGGT